MNKERPDDPRDIRPQGVGGKPRPAPLASPQAGTRSPASQPPMLDAERFIVGIRALDALASRYLAPSPEVNIEVLRRAVTPGDQAILKPLIVECERFVAAFPARHAVWRPLLQQLSRQGGPATVRNVIAIIERSKQLHIEYRMERIAAVAKQLSHMIERFPQRPFADAFRQLTAADQEIFNQAVSRREWSDLFLSPLAQKVLQESRPVANRPPRAASVADIRRRRSAAHTAKQNRPPDSRPPSNRNRPHEK